MLPLFCRGFFFNVTRPVFEKNVSNSKRFKNGYLLLEFLLLSFLSGFYLVLLPKE